MIALAAVMLAAPGTVPSAAAADRPAVAGESVFVEVAGELEFTGELIVRPKPGLAKAQRREALALVAAHPHRHEPRTDEFIVTVAAGPLRPGVAENEVASRLMASGLFDYATPNWRIFPCETPDDPRFPEQWHHAMMQSTAAWELHRADAKSEVIIAVTDTGIVPHEDLANRVPGFNAVTDVAEADGGVLTDIHGHGTHVAGCAAATGDNGVGVSGMGWSLRIMPIRVSEATSGGAFMTDILEGARWAAEHGAKVVSASYSGIGNPPIETTGEYLRSLDASLLWAAGNSATDHAGWDFAHVIVVGASDQADRRADFSSFGLGVDLFAPGVSILSSTRNGSYGNASGTSMATPVANGALALIRSANPQLSAAHAEQILFNSCDFWDEQANSVTFGWGRVNLARAVAYAQSAFVPQPPLARDDRVRAVAGGPIEIDVLANDWDPNLDPLRIGSFAPVTSGGHPVELVPGEGTAPDRLRVPSLGTDAGQQSFAYTVVETTSGATSTATVRIDVDEPRPAVFPTGTEPGVAVAYYELSAPSVLPDFATLTPYLAEVLANVDLASTDGAFAGSGRADDVGAVFEGWLEVPEAGFWNLSLTSDDGSRLRIGDDLVVDNDGLHGMVTVRATRALAAGFHPIRIEFFEGGGGAGVIFRWSGPGTTSQVVPAARLSHGGTLEPADLDGDGAVGSGDLAILLGAWGTAGPLGDLDGDGLVGVADLTVLLGRWND
jgi:thermitase